MKQYLLTENDLKDFIEGVESFGIETALKVLKSTFNPDIESITLNEIMILVTKVTNVSIEQLKSNSRLQEIVTARHIFCYIAKNNIVCILSKISEMVNRNHATAIHSIKVVENALDQGYFEICNPVEVIQEIIDRKKQEEKQEEISINELRHVN